MTASEFREIRKRLGLTQARLAEVLDVSDRFIRMIEAGEYAVEPLKARTMRQFDKHGIPDDWMQEPR